MKTIFPDYEITKKENGWTEFKTLIRKEHSGVWYQHRVRVEFPTAKYDRYFKLCIAQCYNTILFDSVRKDAVPDEDQRTEQERIQELLFPNEK